MKFLVIYLHVVFEFGVVCESVPFLIWVSFFPYISREVFHVAVRLFLFISANLHLVGPIPKTLFCSTVQTLQMTVLEMEQTLCLFIYDIVGVSAPTNQGARGEYVFCAPARFVSASGPLL